MKESRYASVPKWSMWEFPKIGPFRKDPTILRYHIRAPIWETPMYQVVYTFGLVQSHSIYYKYSGTWTLCGRHPSGVFAVSGSGQPPERANHTELNLSMSEGL